ncbi:hypothetical protein BSAF29S_02617 [Bacillus safensis subsp. safensis]
MIYRMRAVSSSKLVQTPSFIKRGDQVMKVQASNLPIGIIDEFEVEVVSEQMKAGDLLIMMSDGIFEGPKHIENHDLWVKRKMKSFKTEDPQEIADLLMEEVIRTRAGQIDDDMTVVVIRLRPQHTKMGFHSDRYILSRTRDFLKYRII